MSIPNEIELSPRFVLDREHELIREKGSKPLRQWIASDSEPALEIFQDRMESWFFEPAMHLMKRGNDIAAVHMVTPLIEALENRCRGESSKDQSKEFFVSRAKEIFGIDEDGLNILYRGVRCGFAHSGFVKDDKRQYNILITSGLASPLVHEGRFLWIDAPKYVEAIHEAFLDYYDLVKRDAEAKRKFVYVWDDEWPMSFRGSDAFGTPSKPA